MEISFYSLWCYIIYLSRCKVSSYITISITITSTINKHITKCTESTCRSCSCFYHICCPISHTSHWCQIFIWTSISNTISRIIQSISYRYFCPIYLIIHMICLWICILNKSSRSWSYTSTRYYFQNVTIRWWCIIFNSGNSHRSCTPILIWSDCWWLCPICRCIWLPINKCISCLGWI